MGRQVAGNEISNIMRSKQAKQQQQHLVYCVLPRYLNAGWRTRMKIWYCVSTYTYI